MFDKCCVSNKPGLKSAGSWRCVQALLPLSVPSMMLSLPLYPVMSGITVVQVIADGLWPTTHSNVRYDQDPMVVSV